MPPTEETLLGGCERRLADVLSITPVPETPERLLIGYFYRVFLRLAGAEVEGKEISFVALIGPKPGSGTPLDEVEELILDEAERDRLDDPIEAVRIYRKRLISRADGSLNVAVIAPEGNAIHGLFRVTLKNARTLPEQLMALTRDGTYVGMWVKPASSIRLYHRGQFHAQAIRLRDGLGWSIRMIAQLIEDVRGTIANSTGAELDRATATIIAEVFCSLSELRLGGSLFAFRSRLAFDAAAEGDVVDRFTPERLALTDLEALPAILTNRLTRDGSTAICVEGPSLVASEVYFHGPGGRRGTAIYVCADKRKVRPVAAVVVSQDGPMYLAGIQEPGGPGVFVDVDSPRYL